MVSYTIDAVAYVQITCNTCGYEWEEDMTGIAGGDYAHDYRGTPECPECPDEDESEDE